MERQENSATDQLGLRALRPCRPLRLLVLLLLFVVMAPLTCSQQVHPIRSDAGSRSRHDEHRVPLPSSLPPPGSITPPLAPIAPPSLPLVSSMSL